MMTLPTILGKARDFWVDHMWADVGLLVLLLAASDALIALNPATDVLKNLPTNTRQGLYLNSALAVPDAFTLAVRVMTQVLYATTARQERFPP